MSGAPLPSAKKVTPATLSERPSVSLMAPSAGQKKSSAVVPCVMVVTRQEENFLA